MDSESAKLLEETHRLSQENNNMLRAMKRSMMWSRVMSVVYWVIIIGITLGSFYFLQPYLNQAQSLYSNASGMLKNLPGR